MGERESNNLDDAADLRGKRLPKGKHGISRERVEALQRQRIIEAMVRTAARRGYSEIAVIDVIKDAGVSRKTFYECFDNLEDCFLASYDYVLGRALDATTRAFDGQGDRPWADRIRTALAELLREIADHPAAARFCVVEVLAAGPKAVIRRDAALREFTHFVEAGRAEARSKLPGMTALAVVGGIYELLYSQILHESTRRLPARLPELVYWVTNPYLGSEEATRESQRAREMMRGETQGKDE